MSIRCLHAYHFVETELTSATIVKMSTEASKAKITALTSTTRKHMYCKLTKYSVEIIYGMISKPREYMTNMRIVINAGHDVRMLHL